MAAITDNKNNQLVIPIDEKKKRVSEILKHVDSLIKSNDLHKALLEIASAKEIDPSNFYTSAIEERIQGLLKHQKNPSAINQRPLGGDMAIPKVNLRTSIGVTDQHSFDPFQAMQTILTKPPLQPFQNRHNESVQEKEKKPEITSESSANQTQKAFTSIKKSPKVLMIDDDTSLLTVLSMTIESGGFEVIPLNTSDEAFALLRKFTPDIILCDINLETSTMGGFTFFEKIQEIDRLKSIPFIFLTGLNDEVLIRTGKEIGADDYLTKPITGQNLLSTIRGRLKRFDQLRASSMEATSYINAALPSHKH